jgi:signal transduction histidine kinase
MLSGATLHPVEESLSAVRAGIIDNVLRAVLFFAPLMFLISISRVPSIGWQPAMAFQLAALVVVLLLWFLRNRLGLATKTWGLILLMFVMSLVGHLQFGLLAAQVGVLVAAPCMAALIFGMRGGLVALLGSILLQAGVAAYVILSGSLPSFDLSDYMLSPLAWTVKVLGLTLSTIVLFVAVSWYSRCLVDALASARLNETRLQEMQRELERRVLARTAELATARDEAESADAVKTRFMSNVSHEMRTPMQAVLGFSRIGRLKVGKASPEELSEYFSKIEQSGQRMLKLVESLLSLAQTAWDEHSRLAEENLQEIAPEQLVNQCLFMMERTARTRQQRIVLENDSAIPFIRGDEARLRQVLEYLIGNALRYSPEQTTVTVKLADESEAPAAGAAALKWLSIQVIDEGCGVPEKEMSAIFEPFYESSRTATGAGGAGLGLALCRTMVSRHGGRLRVANRPQRGAVFEISLPAS